MNEEEDMMIDLTRDIETYLKLYGDDGMLFTVIWQRYPEIDPQVLMAHINTLKDLTK